MVRKRTPKPPGTERLHELSYELERINKSVLEIENKYTRRESNPDGTLKPIKYSNNDKMELKRLKNERIKAENEVKRIMAAAPQGPFKYPINPKAVLNQMAYNGYI